jgi:hypothetical protein
VSVRMIDGGQPRNIAVMAWAKASATSPGLIDTGKSQEASEFLVTRAAGATTRGWIRAGVEGARASAERGALPPARVVSRERGLAHAAFHAFSW